MKHLDRYYVEVTNDNGQASVKFVRDELVLVRLHSSYAKDVYNRYLERYGCYPSLRYLRDHHIRLKRTIL